MGVSNIAQADPAGVRRQPEVKSGFHLVAGQIGHGMARIFGNLAVTDPGSYEFEMVLAVDTGQLSENVGTELGRVGPDDPVLFVHPDDSWHVADCVQLGEVMIGVDQHRVGNLFGELLEGVNIFVDSYRNNREPCVTQFVLQRLPPGQVKSAPSPAGEGHQEPFTACPVGKRARGPGQVRECEVGGPAAVKGFEPVTCGLSDNQQPGVRVYYSRPVQNLGDSQNVDSFVVFNLGAIGDRDANRLTAQAFCTPFPAEQSSKYFGVHDGSPGIPDGFNSRRLFGNHGQRTPAQPGHNRTHSGRCGAAIRFRCPGISSAGNLGTGVKGAEAQPSPR